ncbi:MAG: hypothetical protein JSU04_11740 [Bdellovibrionales bacterium]|nr:hypothetical protein [Bdellovibrionales bacterium]
MKFIILAFLLQALALPASAAILFPTTRPALGLLCSATDTDFKFEMVINQFTGDLFEGTFILSENSKQVPSTVKQYSNYNSNVLIIVSTGPQGDDDDLGYVIELNKSYDGSYYGNATKYVANPPGTRDEKGDTYVRLECQSSTP